jgi:hypothetical protein
MSGHFTHQQDDWTPTITADPRAKVLFYVPDLCFKVNGLRTNVQQSRNLKDDGSDCTLITHSLARRLGLLMVPCQSRLLGSTSGTAEGGMSNVDPSCQLALQLPGVAIACQDVLILPENSTQKIFDCLIGNNILQRIRATHQFDMDRQLASMTYVTNPDDPLPAARTIALSAIHS